MINHTIKPLHDRLQSAYQQLKCCRNIEEKTALQNYIGNLYAAIYCMGDTSIDPDSKKCFGGDRGYERFQERMIKVDEEVLANIAYQKEFHQEFLRQILIEMEKNLVEICPLVFPKAEKFSRKQMIEILFSFFESFGLKEFFEKYYRGKLIHSTKGRQADGSLGYTLYNPLNGDMDLFVHRLKNQYSCMNTMVHELGHAYDLEHFDFGIGQYNQYYYLSFFGETTSRLFERLFFHYMVQNHILENAAKEHFIDFEINDHDIILGSYLVSLLDFQEIIDGDFLYWSDEVFYQKVSEFFSDKDDVMDVLQSTADDDVSTVFTYSYGNILSLFLCDEVENVGFMKEFMEDFYQNRCELFQGKMLEKWGITFDRYRELHKKDIQLIKK